MPQVWVISETPSLSQAVLDLLRTVGFDTEVVHRLEEAEVLERAKPSPQPPVLVSASNRVLCESYHRWRQSPLHSSAMIVLGGRDPTLNGEANLYVVRLPLRTFDFLDLVQRLVADSARTAAGS